MKIYKYTEPVPGAGGRRCILSATERAIFSSVRDLTTVTGYYRFRQVVIDGNVPILILHVTVLVIQRTQRSFPQKIDSKRLSTIHREVCTSVCMFHLGNYPTKVDEIWYREFTPNVTVLDVDLFWSV
jgi:hypothetical protein